MLLIKPAPSRSLKVGSILGERLPFKLRSGFMRTATVTNAIVALRRDGNGAASILRLNSGCISTRQKGTYKAYYNVGNTITQLRDAMSATFKPRTMFAQIIKNKFAT